MKSVIRTRCLQGLPEIGEKAKPKLLECVGPCLSEEQVADLLHLTQGNVKWKMHAKKLLWVKDEATKANLLPAIQFDRGRIASWVVEVIAAIGNGWNAIAFLTRNRRSTGGRSFARLLRDGDPTAVPLIRREAKWIACPEFYQYGNDPIAVKKQAKPQEKGERRRW